MRVYLDHNAGSPLRPKVIEAVTEIYQNSANASSIYQEGRYARGLIENARQKIAELVNADPKFLTFTSGGSEANTTILQPTIIINGKPKKIDQLFVSATEHTSVLTGGLFPPEQIKTIPVNQNGIVDLDWLDAHLAFSHKQGQTFLIAVMLANNETGVIQPVAEISELVHQYGGYFLCDAVQALGRIPVDLKKIGAHFLTLSAHKLGGPQGIGAIVCASQDYEFNPLIRGGGQELNKRAGTENVAAIHGFGMVAELVKHDLKEMKQLQALRDYLEESLDNIVIFGQSASRLPNTLGFAVPGFSAETLLIALDLNGISVSSGSACSSGKVSSSHVLKAMGVPGDLAQSALRISLGWDTKDECIAKFIEIWQNITKSSNMPHNKMTV